MPHTRAIGSDFVLRQNETQDSPEKAKKTVKKNIGTPEKSKSYFGKWFGRASSNYEDEPELTEELPTYQP